MIRFIKSFRKGMCAFLVFALFLGLIPGNYAGAVDLSITRVDLNQTRTVITVKFNQSVTAITGVNLLNRVKLRQNDVSKLLPSDSSVSIGSDSMTITLKKPLNTKRNNVLIEQGVLHEQTDNILSPDFNAEGPMLESDGVSINDLKTRITLQFAEAIGGFPDDATLKNGNIRLARNGTTFSETIPSDRININGSNGRIEIELSTPLEGSNSKISILAGKVKNISTGNINLEGIITPAISAAFDKTPPELDYTSTNLSSDNKTLTMYFTEKIKNMYANGVSSSAAVEILKSHIYVNRNGANYATIGGGDSVTLGDNYIRIKFEVPLTGSNNTVKINGGSISDIEGNVQENIIETGRLIAFAGSSTGAPVYNPSTGSYLSNNNRTVTFQFSSNVRKNQSLTDAQVRANIRVKRENGSYRALSSGDTVEFSGTRVIINLSTAFKGNNNRVIIYKNTVSSLSGVLLASDIESSYFSVDGQNYGNAPTYYNASYNSDAKQVRIYFNRDLKQTSLRYDLTDSIRISRNGGSFSALSSRDSAYIYPANAITIDLSTGLSGNNNRFRIEGGTLEDLYGNIQSSAQYTDYLGGSSTQTNQFDFSLSSDGRTATLKFPYTVYSNFRYDDDIASLKDSIFISRNSGRSFFPLDENDNVTLSGSTLRIIFREAMGSSDLIRIPAKSLKDSNGYPLDFEIKVGADYGNSRDFDPSRDVTLQDDGYTVVFKFNGRIYNNTSSFEALKAMIEISKSGYSFYSLSRSDEISLRPSDGELVIHLSEPINDSGTRIKLLAGAIEVDDDVIDYDIIATPFGGGAGGEIEAGAYINDSPVYFVNTSHTRDVDNNLEYVSVINSTSAISTLSSKPSGVKLSVVLSESANRGILTMSADVLAQLKNKKGVLSLRSGGAMFEIRADDINIKEALEALGVNTSTPELATVEVCIEQSPEEYKEYLDNNSSLEDFSVVVQPMEVSLRFRYLSSSFEVGKFDYFNKKGFILSKSRHSDSNVSIVRIEESGMVSPVPTASSSYGSDYILETKTHQSGVFAVISSSRYFRDTPTWAMPAVNTLASRLVMPGITGGDLKPSESVTRAEVANVITRLLGIYTSAEGASRFFDVTLTDDYFNAVSAASDYKLILGYEDSTFRPDNKITRQEVMSIIARAIRFANEKEVTGDISMTMSQANTILTKFKDRDKISDWAKINMAECAKEGIVNGDDLGCVNPTAHVTRAELAQLAYNILTKYFSAD